MTHQTRKRVVSCGTAPYRFREGAEILLVRPFEEHDTWGIPKGHIHADETYEQCAIRETYEETGIVVAPQKRLVDVRVKYRHEDKTVISYLAKQTCTSKVKIQEEEIVDAKWFAIHNLPSVHAYQIPLIKHAVSELLEM